MVLDYRISLECVFPAVVTGIRSGFGRVGLERQKIGRHRLPTRLVCNINRVGKVRDRVPDRDIGGGFSSMDCRRARGRRPQDKQRCYQPKRFNLPDELI